MLETLENLGESLRSKGGGGKGVSVLSVVFVLIALPSIAEAADQEKYGTVGVEIINLIRPPDFLFPIAPSFQVFDPATGQITSRSWLDTWGDLIDGWIADE